jgi:hypothetical protein
MGKKKTPDADAAGDHASTPLNQLQDPASFGPPPKRSTYGSTASTSTSTGQSAAVPVQGTRLTQSTGGLGAPLSRAQLEEDRRLEQERIEAQRQEEEEPKYNTGPYRADTTGLNTAGLPPPPKFRGAAGSPQENGVVGGRAKAPPPSLPPRLPPRQAASPTGPPPAYSRDASADARNGVLNQGAMSRLGAAGVQVPGFGIGSGTTSPPIPSRASTTSPPVPARSPTTSTGPGASQLSELQSRFSRLKSGASSASSSPPPTRTEESGGGTTWAQKQAALRTASDFHKDPSKVSYSDAKSAAGTANNFRERYGEQVASGWNKASALGQKYGIAERFGRTSTAPPVEGPVSPGLGKKKPAPPPPPAKRVGLGGGAPPPVPMGSKPSLP